MTREKIRRLTRKIAEFARSEGWGIFDIDSTGYLEIQRDDEQGVFASDDDAFDHVFKLSRAGSDLHTKALAIHFASTLERQRP